MLKRISNGGFRKPAFTPPAKWSTRSCKNYAANLTGIAAGDALKNRAMLTINRNDLTATLRRSSRDELTGNNKRLFVRECDSLSTSKSSKSCIESCCADYRIQYDVSVSSRRRFDKRLSSATPSVSVRLFTIHQADIRRLELAHLLSQQRCIAMRG
jgi:hypothetical protein